MGQSPHYQPSHACIGERLARLRQPFYILVQAEVPEGIPALRACRAGFAPAALTQDENPNRDDLGGATTALGMSWLSPAVPARAADQEQIRRAAEEDSHAYGAANGTTKVSPGSWKARL